ncbi:MAG: NADH-quinone oxidoreductase subunit M [Planctomycetota bacterium]|nr:MAG: NADH-quinone oxidoreductase subunit M [Planctomycetota bacterium]
MAESTLLTATWVIPFLIALFTIFIPKENDSSIKRFNLIGSGINLSLVIYLTVRFVNAMHAGLGDANGLYFAKKVPWFGKLNIEYNIGVDGISILMMLLTGIVVFCGVLASWGLKDQTKEFFIMLNILVAGVFGVFISFDLFTFFLFYEVAVLPMYLLIGLWGTGKKEYAAMKLTLMLVGGSALILAGILGLYFEANSFDIMVIAQTNLPESFQYWAFPALFLGFGILGALFPFHTWSPDGHASAPTAVSMLHAGVLMKLGGYGCLRVAIFLCPEGCNEWMSVFLILTTINICYGAFAAIKQTDLKYVTAYSSVSHCGFVLFAFAAMTQTAFQGAVLQMISHGLMTALFFCLIGMIYGRTHTRIMGDMGGLMQRIPFLGVAFIIAGLASLGLPGLSGFVAEVTIFVGAFENGNIVNRVCTVLAILSIVVTAVYVLRAANQMLMGPLNPEFEKLEDATYIEKIPVIILLFCLFAFGISPGWIIEIVNHSIEPIFKAVGR